MVRMSAAIPAGKQTPASSPAHTAGGLLLQVVRYGIAIGALVAAGVAAVWWWNTCLLYTSDAADE